ncbi:unnamed protein product, partial [marine sediment metagenome]
MDWLASYWTWILLAFYVAEKIVKESDAKWDDILVDGLKYLATKFYNALE